jgi:hypothetical protein
MASSDYLKLYGPAVGNLLVTIGCYFHLRSKISEIAATHGGEKCDLTDILARLDKLEGIMKQILPAIQHHDQVLRGMAPPAAEGEGGGEEEEVEEDGDEVGEEEEGETDVKTKTPSSEEKDGKAKTKSKAKASKTKANAPAKTKAKVKAKTKSKAKTKVAPKKSQEDPIRKAKRQDEEEEEEEEEGSSQKNREDEIDQELDEILEGEPPDIELEATEAQEEKPSPKKKSFKKKS